jgi:hypothetical protein
MVERAGAGLGIKAHAHMLRHACGYALANAGVDTRDLWRPEKGFRVNAPENRPVPKAQKPERRGCCPLLNFPDCAATSHEFAARRLTSPRLCFMVDRAFF